MLSHTSMHVISSLIHLLGVSILSHIISRRFMVESYGTLSGASWPRICVMLAFIDSYLFLFIAGLLIMGVDMEHDRATCSMGIYLCIISYGSSKFLIYCFLVERVHIVWRPSPTTKRLKSRAYLACIAVLSCYPVVVGLLFYGQISILTDNGVCKIGLKPIASIPLLSYDLFITVFLTGLFVLPLFRSNYRNSRIRRLGVRTLCSAFVALVTSCINILILTLMHGRQLGWVCLGSCGTDVVINAMVLFWVTDSASEKSASSGPGPAPCQVHVSYGAEHNHHSSLPPAADTKADHEDLESKRGAVTNGFKRVFSGRKRQLSTSDIFGATSVEVRITRETDVHESSIADTDYEMRKMDSDK